ncbi:MAG: metallophosphoesterase [Acidobacteriota bacterium]
MPKSWLAAPLATLLVMILAGFQQVTLHKTDVPAHPWDIVLARPTDTSVAASLMIYRDATVTIEYGTGRGLYSRQTTPLNFKAGLPAAIELGNLTPNTRYYYRLRISGPAANTDEVSPEYTFTTARPPGSSFVFAMQADSHLDENTEPAIYARAVENMLADGVDFVVDLGDTFMNDKYSPDYKEAEKQYLAQRYYFGLVGHSAHWFLALGNHDGEQGRYLNGTVDNMTIWSNRLRKSHFPNPVPNSFYTGNTAPDPLAGPIENYFAWQWGDAHFIVLDPFWVTKRTGQSDGWAWTLGRAQYDWLTRTLAESTSRYKFVFLHHLIGGRDNSQRGGIEAAKYFEWGGHNLTDVNEFAVKRPGWAMPIHQLLVRHRVSAVFHGHDHLYVKQDLDGIVYQEVPQPGYPRFNQANSAADYGYVNGTILGSPGHLRVTVTPERARVDLVRPVLPKDETASRRNREIGHSFEIRAITPLAVTSAASYSTAAVAPESIVATFGLNLAAGVNQASQLPLPMNLGGVTINVRDAGGVERAAPLFFVSPAQLNFQVPSGLATGSALVESFIDGQIASRGMIQINPISPAIFTADSSGSGYPAATLLRYRGSDLVGVEPVFDYDPVGKRFIGHPIDPGPAGEAIFLVIYGTGFRNHGGLGSVGVRIGGIDAQVVYAGAQGDYVGLDQLNVRIPRELAGRGEVDLVLNVGGLSANPVRIRMTGQ